MKKPNSEDESSSNDIFNSSQYDDYPEIISKLFRDEKERGSFAFFLRAIEFHGSQNQIPEWIVLQAAQYLEAARSAKTWSQVLGAINKSAWTTELNDLARKHARQVYFLYTNAMNKKFASDHRLRDSVASLLGLKGADVEWLWKLMTDVHGFKPSHDRPVHKRDRKDSADIEVTDKKYITELKEYLRSILPNSPKSNLEN